MGSRVQREKGREGVYKVAFWNVAGIGNKGKDFWREVKEWDIIMLCETWLDVKGWERAKRYLPRGFRWEVQVARRKSKRGRAMGRMLVGIRIGIEVESVMIREGMEGIVAAEIGLDRERWRIVGVYVNGDLDRKMDMMRGWMDEKETEYRTLIGGDFNARTGERGGRVVEEDGEGGGEGRRSKDKKVNREGRVLLGRMEEVGWEIFNGGMRGDREGEWTYTGGRGESVIDYVLGNIEVKERIERMEIGDNIDSDHHPLVLWIKAGKKRIIRGGRRRVKRWVWSMEGRKEFREMLGEVEESAKGVEEEWSEMRKRIQGMLEKGDKLEQRKAGRGWWDEECEEGKRRVRRELRKWRKRKGKGRRTGRRR